MAAKYDPEVNRAIRRFWFLLDLGTTALGTRRRVALPTVESARTERVAVVRSVDGSTYGYADVPAELIQHAVEWHGN